MSRFMKLSHVLWHCQYHIVWVPKFRYRVLKGVVAEEVLCPFGRTAQIELFLKQGVKNGGSRQCMGLLWG